MKKLSKINLWLWALTLGGALTAVADPATKTPPAKITPIRSVFIIPTGPKEGRDPFYPESSRVYEANAPTAPTVVHVDEITNLKIKGHLIVNGQDMVIINNHSFMVGDEGDVLTSSGRVHLRCLSIRGGTAVIDAGGQRIDLRY